MDVNIKENIDNLLKLINTPIHDEDWKRNVDDSIHKFSGGITKFITMFKHNIKIDNMDKYLSIYYFALKATTAEEFDDLIESCQQCYEDIKDNKDDFSLLIIMFFRNIGYLHISQKHYLKGKDREERLDISIKENLDNSIKLIGTRIHDEEWKNNVDNLITKSNEVCKFVVEKILR